MEFYYIFFGNISAIKATTFKVTFNKAVADTTKAVFAVKKSGIVVNVAKVTFAEDKKSADVQLATKLTKGDYTVSVSGLSTEAITGTATGILDETATKIEISSDKVAAVYTGANITSVKVGYAVTNQYGEDITTSAPVINWNSTFGTVTPDTTNGVLGIATQPTTMLGQVGVITGVMTSPAVVVTKNVTVGQAATVDSITFSSLYNADNKTINTASTYTDYVVVFDAKDQYGNNLEASDVNTDMFVTSTNPSIFTVTTTNPVVANQGAKLNQLGIRLEAPVGTAFDGTASIRMISKRTGKIFEFPITIAKASTVDTFTMSSPVKTVAVNETVEIPFTAADQNGAAVTSYTALNSKVTFPAQGNGTLALSNDYINKKAVLKYTAPATKGSYILMSLTPSGKTSQLIVEVKDGATAGYISGLNSKIVTNVALGGKVTLNKDSFLVKDQYGRDLDITTKLGPTTTPAVASVGKYQVVVAKSSSADAYTTISTNNFVNVDNTSVDITGAKKGTSSYIAKLYVINATGNYELVKGSEFAFNVSVTDKSDIVSYEIGTLPTLFDTATAGYDVTLKVYGVKADGSKVVMPASDYNVVSTDAHLTYTLATNKLAANGLTYAANSNDTTASIIVTVNAADNGVVLTKEVKVSKTASAIATLSLDDTYSVANAEYESDGLISIVAANVADMSALNSIVSAAIYAEDQYGVEVATDAYTVVITNMAKDETGTVKTIKDYNEAASTTIAAGDTFNVTAVTANGKTIQFKVVCK